MRCVRGAATVGGGALFADCSADEERRIMCGGVVRLEWSPGQGMPDAERRSCRGWSGGLCVVAALACLVSRGT